MSAVHTETFDTAEDFLAYLQVRHERWLPDNYVSSPWVFRGHSDAEWNLVPSAWRQAGLGQEKTDAEKIIENVKEQCRLDPVLVAKADQIRQKMEKSDRYKIGSEERVDRLIALFWQAMVEVKLVIDFSSFADELGHRLPSGQLPMDWESILGNADYLITRCFEGICDEIFRISPVNCQFALAQHHGIPTRLLDWTRSPFMAAFFAAESVRSHEAEHLIGVWAIRADVIPSYPNDSSELKTLTCPRSEISYLHAQHGLFTHDDGGYGHFVEHGTWRSTEDAIQRIVQSLDDVPLRRITLPTSECGALLRLLWAEGITRAHLMPTYDNVAATLKTKWL